MSRSKLSSSDSDAEVLAAQEKYLAAKIAVQERKKRKREEAEQKWAEKERKERKITEAAAEEEKKKKEAAEAEKAKKVDSSKAARKWRAVEESDLDNMEMVNEAPPKCKRRKMNMTVKYRDRNLCRRCKHLNIECVAK